MSVSFEAQGTTDATASAATSISFNNLTVVAGNALVVTLSFQGALPSGLTVTWDSGGTNQACAPITGAAGANGTTVSAALYGLINPTPEKKTLVAS